MDNMGYYVEDNSDIDEKKIEAAKNLYISGDYSSALKIYLDISNASYSYKLYYEIGRCYYKLNDLTQAEIYFKQSISLDSDKNPSYLYLGNIYSRNENLSEAISAWIRAYSAKPDDENICLSLATSYFTKGMKFQSVMFYEKYLKYAKDKTSEYYLEIKKSIEDFERAGQDFYKKAKTAYEMNDTNTAIQALLTAHKNYPLNFDVNLLLGKLYYFNKEYEDALIYLKQAYCVDNKSIDLLQLMSAVMTELNDLTGAYCCLKRTVPLVLNNQRNYLDIIKAIKHLEEKFESAGYHNHLELADNYFNDNNYHFALFEYENCMIIDNSKSVYIDDKIELIKSFMNPEERIVKACFEKGTSLYSSGNFRQANKYFTKVMSLTNEYSSEYKFAKSRIKNV